MNYCTDRNRKCEADVALRSQWRYGHVLSNGQDDGERDTNAQIKEKSGLPSSNILLYGLKYDVAYS